MTARTHDLTAFTGLTISLIYFKFPSMSLATAMTAFGANFLGGLFPDLDESSSAFWKNIRGGSIFGKIIAPLLGGHRNITHSLIGLGLMYYLLGYFLPYLKSVLIVDMEIVKWSFIIGYVSHLFIDSFTTEGIPLFFPIQKNLGIPPIRKLRIHTGGLVEKIIVFPSLLICNFWLISTNYQNIIIYIQNMIYNNN